MPESAPAPISGRRRRKNRASAWACAALLLLLGGGCKKAEPPAPSMESAVQHAKIIGANTGYIVIVNAQEQVFLHPDSERQRQARRQLLRLQEIFGEGAGTAPGENRTSQDFHHVKED